MSNSTTTNHKQKQIIIKPIEVLTNQLKEDLLLDDEIILEHKETELINLKEEIKQAEVNLKAIQSEIKAEQDNWESEKNTLMETAYEEGYANGFTSGSEQGLKQYDTIIQQANEISASISKAYEEKLKQSEGHMAILAIACAEKILNQKLTEEPGDFLHIVKAVLSDVNQKADVTLLVHPNKYELVKKKEKELTNEFEPNLNLTIQLDYRLEENNCVVEHDSAQVLAGVKPELDILRRMLLEIIAEEEK